MNDKLIDDCAAAFEKWYATLAKMDNGDDWAKNYIWNGWQAAWNRSPKRESPSHEEARALVGELLQALQDSKGDVDTITKATKWLSGNE